jgi:hypothetical protein
MVLVRRSNANALEPMREKQAEIHRGSRRQNIGPLKEAGYTSAIVILNQTIQTVAIRRGPYTSTHDIRQHVAMLRTQSAFRTFAAHAKSMGIQIHALGSILTISRLSELVNDSRLKKPTNSLLHQ